MSKVGGSISSWYWPEGIPRRVAVPQQPLDGRLRYRLATESIDDLPWIVLPERKVTYSELLEEVGRRSRALQETDFEASVVAVVEPDLREAVSLMLAALAAGKQVFLTDPDVEPERLALLLERSGSQTVLTAATEVGDVPGVRVIRASELQDGPMTKRPPRSYDMPALLLADGENIVVHSHFSAAAMGTSLTSFIPPLKELPFVALHGLWHWEDLTGVLGSLLYGSYVVPARLDQDALPGESATHAILSRADADQLLEWGRAPNFSARLRYIFVSVGNFEQSWRHRVERLLGRTILPLWGSAEVGPAVAAHPSWVPFDGHGISMVNVDLKPADPASGAISDVPWELLAEAELAIESPSQMLRLLNPVADAAARTGQAIRSHVLATVDAVGVVRFCADRRVYRR